MTALVRTGKSVRLPDGRTIAQVSRASGLPLGTVYRRWLRGWPAEKLGIPLRRDRPRINLGGHVDVPERRRTAMTAPTVALVGCGAAKRQGLHLARDLYTSDLFRKSLAYAERLAPGRTFVVSALYGLLDLEREVGFYEYRLCRGEAPLWARQVVGQLADELPGAPLRLVVLAGALYAKPLRAEAEARGWTVEEPLRGLGIGRRLSFLKHHLEVTP